MGGAGPGAEITVVVPTHNRPEQLRECLASLSAQSGPGDVEIIVVDDGSEDGGRVAEVVAAVPRARLVRQSRQGPGAARNAGVRAARGPVICLTDDDCEPEPGWLATMAEAVLDGADVVAGRTVVGDPARPLNIASQLVMDAITNGARIPFAASNNLGFTARLLEQLPFDERYPDAAGEDRDWCERVHARGFRIERRPASVVHRPDVTLRTYLGRNVRYGRGAYRYHRAWPSRRPLERPAFYAALLRAGFRAGPAVGFLVVGGQLATAWGYVREGLARS